MSSLQAEPWGPEARRHELLATIEDATLLLLRSLVPSEAVEALHGVEVSGAGEKLGASLLALLGGERRDLKSKGLRLRRMIALLDSLHGLLSSGRHATPRELYYSHVTLFQRQQQSDDMLKWLCRLLRVPRHHLRLVGTAKGLVRGHLRILEPSSTGSIGGVWVEGLDPLEPRGHAIAPISAHIVRVESMARVVLIAEKETIFHRLLSEGFLERHRPCILVTARGFPDLPSRYFLRRLCEDCAAPRILILVDFDAAGLSIAATYALGQEETWIQDDISLPSAVPLICSGGAVGAERFGLKAGDTAPLTHRDFALAHGLQKRLTQGVASAAVIPLRRALDQLLKDGRKYEIDSLDRLSEFVDDALLNKEPGMAA